MDLLLEKLRAAVQPLLGIRAAIWLALVALAGFGLGAAMNSGIGDWPLDLALFVWVLAVGAAACDMRAAEQRAERRRKQKLDALYGRRS